MMIKKENLKYVVAACTIIIVVLMMSAPCIMGMSYLKLSNAIGDLAEIETVLGADAGVLNFVQPVFWLTICACIVSAIIGFIPYQNSEACGIIGIIANAFVLFCTWVVFNDAEIIRDVIGAAYGIDYSVLGFAFYLNAIVAIVGIVASGMVLYYAVRLLTPIELNKRRAKFAHIASWVIVCVIAFLFIFPLYWIITGSFKIKKEIISSTPVWIPSQWVLTNYENLMSKRSAPLFEFFGIVGPTVPGALRWLLNTVFMSVASMLLTCLTAAMAGYALAKKRFFGRGIIFTLIVCAMALPKQVILIPLLREMSALKLYDTIWAVIFPIVGWPFGVFLLKQFAEGIPTEMTEACRIDGASEWRTFTDVMFPMIKPGVGACAIFTFINSWNDYFMQLIMLTSSKNLTISLGIATMQGENSTDFGLLMAGCALASVPIIIVFLIFQKYFTKGITMGAVKG